MTRPRMASDTTDCAAIVSLAHGASGMTSVDDIAHGGDAIR